MTRRFTAQHTASGYSAMGGSLARPRIGMGSTRTVAESIAAARRAAAREASRKKK